MRFKSLHAKKKKIGQRSGRGLCENGKSFDGVDLHLNENKSLM